MSERKNSKKKTECVGGKNELQSKVKMRNLISKRAFELEFIHLPLR